MASLRREDVCNKAPSESTIDLGCGYVIGDWCMSYGCQAGPRGYVRTPLRVPSSPVWGANEVRFWRPFCQQWKWNKVPFHENCISPLEKYQFLFYFKFLSWFMLFSPLCFGSLSFQPPDVKSEARPMCLDRRREVAALLTPWTRASPFCESEIRRAEVGLRSHAWCNRGMNETGLE